ncbi:MAG: IS200/IS605 family transposase [Pseudomonadota bacterium]
MEHFNRLAHSIWDCKYHIVWIPKYRRKELYGAKRRTVVDTIKQWARIKGIEIIDGHAMPDHIHLCVSIPPKYAVANTIGLLLLISLGMLYFCHACSFLKSRNSYHWQTKD